MMQEQDPATRIPSTAEEVFRDFEKTAFYRWADGVIQGRFRWLILPCVGFLDAFVVILPTEFAIVLYMMRNRDAYWWWQSVVTTFFAGVGYVFIAFLVALFGIDAVAWLGVLTGQEIATSIDVQFRDHVLVFAIMAGATSFVPMPLTAFAVFAGLFGWSLPLLFVGACVGKFVRFGLFAYGTHKWGQQIITWYMRHANAVSLALLALLVLYLVLQ